MIHGIAQAGHDVISSCLYLLSLWVLWVRAPPRTTERLMIDFLLGDVVGYVCTVHSIKWHVRVPVQGMHVMYMCGGQRTTEAVSSHLSSCWGRDSFSFTSAYARLADVSFQGFSCLCLQPPHRNTEVPDTSTQLHVSFGDLNAESLTLTQQVLCHWAIPSDPPLAVCKQRNKRMSRFTAVHLARILKLW